MFSYDKTVTCANFARFLRTSPDLLELRQWPMACCARTLCHRADASRARAAQQSMVAKIDDMRTPCSTQNQMLDAYQSRFPHSTLWHRRCRDTFDNVCFCQHVRSAACCLADDGSLGCYRWELTTMCQVAHAFPPELCFICRSLCACLHQAVTCIGHHSKATWLNPSYAQPG